MAKLIFETHYPEIVDEAMLRDLLEQSPSGEELLWNKRNQVWRIQAPDGETWAVKRFSTRFPKAFVYALRAGKARRSYLYASAMQERGVNTPAPVAYAELRGPGNLLLGSLYISRYEPSEPLEALMPEGSEREYEMYAASHSRPRDPEWIPAALAEYAAGMHARGVVHNDFNVTNVRLPSPIPPLPTVSDFSLIDLNRAHIYPKGENPSLKERFDDIVRFMPLDEAWLRFARLYLRAARIPESEMPLLLERKRRFDARKARKRKFKSILRRRRG